MNTFIQKHAADVLGVLSGFDRLVFRGTARHIAYVEGMRSFLSARNVLLKDFGAFAHATSERVKAASIDVAKRAGRPVVYLASATIRKDEQARMIAERDGIADGLIAVFSTVEPFRGFDIFRNREAKRLELVMRQRKCTHLYHYIQHPIFGFMHIRLQTWFPFQVQIWINGREWLARTLDRKKVAYERRENCFPWLANVARAQRLMDEQLNLAWPTALEILRFKAHPIHEEIFAPSPVEYYWSVYQSEWATDVMFRDRQALASLYDRLVHQGITRFHCRDILRFLGKKVSASGRIHPAFAREVTSDVKERPEGIRLKHRVGANSIKIYDKQGTVLRAETTLNDPDGFKVYRAAEGDTRGTLGWRPMRRGVADLQRRAEVSQAVNDRYLDALASIENSTALGDLTRPVCRPTTWKGRRVRPLHLWSPDDLALFRSVGRGEFLLSGFRNADLRRLLHPKPSSVTIERQRAAAVTRKLRLLRAHGIIARRQKSHRYIMTPKGQRIVTAILAAHHASPESLMKLAA